MVDLTNRHRSDSVQMRQGFDCLRALTLMVELGCASQIQRGACSATIQERAHSAIGTFVKMLVLSRATRLAMISDWTLISQLLLRAVWFGPQFLLLATLPFHPPPNHPPTHKHRHKYARAHTHNTQYRVSTPRLHMPSDGSSSRAEQSSTHAQIAP